MHPSEGMWQEFLDGESEAPVQRELAIHTQICPDCQRTVAVLDRGRAFAAELLDYIDAEVPLRSPLEVLSRLRRQQRAPRQSLLAAAVVALCVVTAAGATVRTGLIHRAMNWLLGPAPQVESHFPPTPQSSPDYASSTGIAMVPAGPVEIAFEQWPSRGEIEIAVRLAAEVSVTASVPSAYSVRRGRIEVANRGVAASYRIVLPQTVSVAAIRVGGKVVFSRRGTAIATQAKKTGPDSYLLSFSTSTRAP